MPVVNIAVKVNALFTVATWVRGRLELGIGLGLELVLTLAVSDLWSGDRKANIYRREYPRNDNYHSLTLKFFFGK